MYKNIFCYYFTDITYGVAVSGTRHGRGTGINRRVGRPIFTEEPVANLHFSNNSGGVLNCAAAGTDPPPSISWLTTDGRQVHQVC